MKPNEEIDLDKFKPCVSCDKLCKMIPVQLGDFYTLVFLRICDGFCLFNLSYDYLYTLYEHKNFMNSLCDLEDKDDKKTRTDWQDEITATGLLRMRESLEENKNMLSLPVPEEIINRFLTQLHFSKSGETMTFKKYIMTKEQRLENHNKYINSLQERLKVAEIDLEKIQEET